MKRTTVTLPLVAGGEKINVWRVARDAARVPTGGWLRAGRLAKGIPQRQLAAKLGFKRQAWAQLEESEARDAISLYSLRRAADALGFDLVYYLVPRSASGGMIPAGEPAKTRRGPREETMAPHPPAESPPAPAVWQELELPLELR